jgi:hypothetical protein
MASVLNRTMTIDIPLDISTAAYTAGDVVGGLIAVDVHSAGGGGILRRLTLVDTDEKDAAFYVYVFDGAPDVIDDDDPFAPDADDLLKLIGRVHIEAGDYLSINDISVALKGDLAVDYTSGDGFLYLYLVAVATPDFDEDDALTLRVTVWGD